MAASSELRDARWIWSDGDRFAYQQYVRFRRDFELADSPTEGTLRLTADAYYQAWLNGVCLGSGPCKSAEGERFVDALPVGRFLQPGPNRLEILVMCMGAGSFTYVPAAAGLIYALEVGEQRLVSDAATLVSEEPTRQQASVRLWFQPAVDLVDLTREERQWRPASEVGHTHRLRPRRVPLASREPCLVQRLVHADRVRLPNQSFTFRCRGMLLPEEERLSSELYTTPGCFVTELISPIEQELRVLPSMGSIAWYADGRLISKGTGWSYSNGGTVRLRKGANRFYGNHLRNHVEEASFCGWSAEPVTVRNPFGQGLVGLIPLAYEALPEHDDELAALTKSFPEMSWLNGNAHDLAHHAEPLPGNDQAYDELLETTADEPLVLPAAEAGAASRLIVDLGAVCHGWLSWRAVATAGSRLTISLVEYLDEPRAADEPPRIQWPVVAHNTVAVRLREGRQSFETMHHYAGRYLIVMHEGEEPLRLEDLRLLSATCGSRPRGYFRCSDPLLNEIYEIAVRSCIAGVDDTFTDCPLFEQVNWNFDNRAAYWGESWSIANLAVARHSILLFAEDPRSDGLVNSQYPSSWHDTAIPNWSFHWIMWVRDYVVESGDGAFARELWPRIAAGLDEALARCRPDGLFSWPEAWHFIEWGAGRDDEGVVLSHEQACLAGALEAACWLSDQLGEDSTAWSEARDKLAAACNAQLWCEERGAYADALKEDGSLSSVSSQTNNAALVAYGLATAEREAIILEHLRHDRLLLPGSPYGLFYVFAALDRVGDGETIFRHIRHRWGDMVRAGDKTLWEMFNRSDEPHAATRSRCHPFAAYVVRYLLRYVLGYQGLDDAGEPVWSPKPPAGIDFCRGSVPTRNGLVHYRWPAD